MKMLAKLALVAGTLALGAPAATAAALSPLAKTSPVAGSAIERICGCRHGNDVAAGVYGGFVSAPDGGYYGQGYSGFYDRGFDDPGAAPPYAFFPNRDRVYRMWGWNPRDRSGYGNNF